MDELTQEEYLARFMFETDQKSFLRTAHNKGVAEGRAEGRSEERLETARRMLADGMEVSLISKYTGLTAEEISTLSSTDSLPL